MKIGILTFHYAYNFGAVWQCYGLQQTLMRLGYRDVEVINVIPRKWHWFLMGIPLNLSKLTLMKGWQKICHWKESKQPFDEFRRQYLHCSEPFTVKEIGKHSTKYDAIIVGSDQVWVPAQRKDRLYFLNWSPSFKGRRIAYAPCCATEIINEKYKNTLRNALCHFDSLSVRNISTQNFVRILINKDVPLMPDPTILADYSFFVSDSKERRPYILSFVLGSDIKGGNQEAFKILRKAHPDCKILSVVVPKSTPIIVTGADEVRYDVNPVEWLNLIAYARIVYTDSFHCTIFSMKFHTPFVAYYSDPIKKSRFEDLRMRYGVGAHIAQTLDDVEKAGVLSSTNCDVLLQKQKEMGEKYLIEALTGKRQ